MVKSGRDIPHGADGRSTVLAMASTLQLLVSLVGLRKAMKEKIPYDMRFMKGSAGHIVRDQFLLGGALSPPTTMMVAQAVGTAWLFKNPGPAPSRLLGVLGLLMSVGFPMERLFTESLRSPSRSTTSMIAGGESMAILMAVLGLTKAAERPTRGRARASRLGE
jgi:hypothetical protein